MISCMHTPRTQTIELGRFETRLLEDVLLITPERNQPVAFDKLKTHFYIY